MRRMLLVLVLAACGAPALGDGDAGDVDAGTAPASRICLSPHVSARIFAVPLESCDFPVSRTVEGPDITFAFSGFGGVLPEGSWTASVVVPNDDGPSVVTVSDATGSVYVTLTDRDRDGFLDEAKDTKGRERFTFRPPGRAPAHITNPTGGYEFRPVDGRLDLYVSSSASAGTIARIFPDADGAWSRIEGIVAGSNPTAWEDTLRPADVQAQTEPGEQAFDSVRGDRVLSRTYVHHDAAGRVDRYETDWFDPDGAAPADLGVGRDGQHHTVTRVVLTYAAP